MGSSILQQYWSQQEKQGPLFPSTPSNIPTIDDRLTDRSDGFSPKSFLQTDSQSKSTNSLSTSSNSPIKEFCSTQKEEDDEEKSSFKRRLAAHLCSEKCKTCSIGFILGGLLAAIALSTVLAIYIKDQSTTKVTTTTTTTTSSTSSTTTSSSTSTSSTTSTSTSTTTSSTTSTTTSATTSSTTSTETTTSTTTSSTTSTETTTSVTETTTTPKICANGDTTITFDDLTSSGSIPSGYTNFNWTNAYSYTATTNTSGYYTGTVSGNCTSYNAFGDPMTMQSANGSLFTLYSAAVAAAWCNDLQLTVIGYHSNMIIANNTFTLQMYTVAYITFSGYSGLDTAIFSTSGGTSTTNGTCSGTQYATDNICLSFT